MNSIVLQGTKILEDREVRHKRCAVTKHAPQEHTSTRIIKYTGDLASPQWKDVEPGRVFSFPWYFVKSAQSPKDKFETLCRVKANISSAPYTSKLGETGNTGYRRDFKIILLVGLTELKAQASWIDSETVRGISFDLHPSTHFIQFPYARI